MIFTKRKTLIKKAWLELSPKSDFSKLVTVEDSYTGELLFYAYSRIFERWHRVTVKDCFNC